MNGISPPRTLCRFGGVWREVFAGDREGQISAAELREAGADRDLSAPRDPWSPRLLARGRVYTLDEATAAELERDGFGAWVGDEPRPGVVTRTREASTVPSLTDAFRAIDELRVENEELRAGWAATNARVRALEEQRSLVVDGA